jgi:hypothetical protein
MQRKGFVVAALALLAVAAIGCSSSAATPGSMYYPDANGNFGGPTAAPAVPAAATPADLGSAPEAVPAGSSGTSGSSTAPGAPAVNQDQIIKTGSITIEVANVDDAVALATDQMHVLGGWMANSNRTTDSGVGLASVTFRVPVARFEDAIGLMRKLGKKVISEKSDSQSVGGQIVDLQARIDNLKASEKAIQAIMDQAKTIPDVLEVQQRLSDVQGQIEEMTAQMTGLTDQSAYSTLTVIFEVPASASPSPTPEPSATPAPWSAGQQFNQAAAELGGVGQNVATGAIWTIVLILPVALGLLLLILILILIGRVLEPFRHRWLPVTAARTATPPTPGWISKAPAVALPLDASTWPGAGTPIPPAGQPGPTQSGTDPEPTKP